MLGKPSLAVDEPGAHTDCTRAGDVVLRRIADHDRTLGVDPETVETRAEDRLVRLRLAVQARGEDRVDLDAVMRDELVEVAPRVREKAELEVAPAQVVEDGQRVLVELEMLGPFPRARHLARAGIRVPFAAHP